LHSGDNTDERRFTNARLRGIYKNLRQPKQSHGMLTASAATISPPS
jgi:hypothetical protein